MEEVWKPIKGYEGLYEVSNLGRVKSLFRYTVDKNGKRYTCREKIRKPHLDPQGYYYVTLCKNAVSKPRRIHRLVALHHLIPIAGCDVVNHLNGVKTDNRAINLEWTTKSGNAIHAYSTGLVKFTPEWRKRISESTPKTAVIATNTANGATIMFESMISAEEFGFTTKGIQACCVGKQHTHRGFRFKYAYPNKTRRNRYVKQNNAG